MQMIFLLGLPFLIENVYNVYSTRSFLKQTFICRILPAVFTYFFRIISSSIFSRKQNLNINQYIFILALISEASGCLKVFYSVSISAVYNEIAYNSQIIFLAFFAYFMLKRRFSKTQIIGQCIIFVGICWSGYNSNIKKDTISKGSAIGFLAIVLAALMASLRNIYFEKYIRPKIVDFNTYNMQLSFISFFVCLCSSSIEMFSTEKEKIFLTLIDLKFYNYVIVSVIHNTMTLYISTKVEPIVRSFMMMVINNVTYIIIDYVEQRTINVKSLIDLSIINVGIIFYEMQNVKKLYARFKNRNDAGDADSTEK